MRRSGRTDWKVCAKTTDYEDENEDEDDLGLAAAGNRAAFFWGFKSRVVFADVGVLNESDIVHGLGCGRRIAVLAARRIAVTRILYRGGINPFSTRGMAVGPAKSAALAVKDSG